MIYLDYNATAPMRPEVISAMAEAALVPANPSSMHALGRKAKARLESARERVAHVVSAWPNEIIFTASGSEANNMALRGFSDRPVLVGATEHASVSKAAQRLGGDLLPVDRNGHIDLAVLEAKLQALGQPALLSVMLANNETGVIQPMEPIVQVARAYQALVHCDAVQAVGKIPVDFGLLGVDMLTLSAHKCGGPLGVGALVVRNDLVVKPLITGGGQELGRRAGTENIVAIEGMALAMELAASLDWVAAAQAMRDEAEAMIIATAPDAVIAGADVARLPNTSCIMMPNVPSETQLMTFDLDGICVSAGSACSSGRIEPSHVLLAMGYEQRQAGCALRMSCGWNSTAEELKFFTETWKKTYMRLVKNAA